MKILTFLPVMLLTSFMGWLIFQANNANNNIFFDIVKVVPFGDKIGHVILYGSLSYVTIIALQNKQISIGEYLLPLGAVIVSICAITEEVCQLFLINRRFDLIDMFADLLGILIFSLLYQKKPLQLITD